jgi:Zn-dependent protease
VTGIPLEQVRDSLLYLIALILSITVHEFGHAWMANRLGDRLPAAQGRVTLNPLRHIDPIGTILFPLLARAGMPVLGWGKPVQTNPAAYTRKVTMRGGHAMVAMAGPAMNLVMAIVTSLLAVVLAKTIGLPGDMLGQILEKLVGLNLFLMFFNLLPERFWPGCCHRRWATSSRLLNAGDL